MKRILIVISTLLISHSAWAQSTCGAALTGVFPAAQAAKMCSEFAAASDTNAAGWKISGSNVYTSTGNVGVGVSTVDNLIGAKAVRIDGGAANSFAAAIGLQGAGAIRGLLYSNPSATYLSSYSNAGLVFSTVAGAFGNNTGTARLSIKTTGQLNFVPLAADPTPAAAGDVYYNSGTNKLRVYNGSIWVDLH